MKTKNTSLADAGAQRSGFVFLMIIHYIFEGQFHLMVLELGQVSGKEFLKEDFI